MKPEKISAEVLQDAGLTPAVMKAVRDEINGSEKEALEFWRIISERTRGYFRESVNEKSSDIGFF
jgi:hypothetical protein